MSSEKIKNKFENNEEVIFYPETISSVLMLNKERFGFEKVRKIALEKRLNEKPEIHSTIIGYDQGKEIMKHFLDLTSDQKQEKLDEIKKVLQIASLKVEPLDDYYLIEKNEDIISDGKTVSEHRESIIQMTKVDSGDIYQKLSNICGFILEPTFPHVTLFTTSSIEAKKLRGIGLYSEKDFDDIKKTKLFL